MMNSTTCTLRDGDIEAKAAATEAAVAVTDAAMRTLL